MAESTLDANPIIERNAADYEELEGEYVASQQHLRSKEQALRILQGQLKKADLTAQRLKQEMKQLRSQLSRTQLQVSSPSATTSPRIRHNSDTISVSINEELIKEKELLIQELEKAQWQISELERHIEQLEDEKEDLVDEKAHFSSKCEGLVKCLEEEKKKQPPSQFAVQRVMEENRQLQLALVESEAEKEHCRSRVDRYKSAIERRKSLEAATEQVENSPDKKRDLRVAGKRIAELETLANSLSQSVKVKSVTITHQKKANRMLATKLAELEHQLNLRECNLCNCNKTTIDTGRKSPGDNQVAVLNRKSQIVLNRKSPGEDQTVLNGKSPGEDQTVLNRKSLGGDQTVLKGEEWARKSPGDKLSAKGESAEDDLISNGLSDRKPATGDCVPTDRKSVTGDALSADNNSATG